MSNQPHPTSTGLDRISIEPDGFPIAPDLSDQLHRTPGRPEASRPRRGAWTRRDFLATTAAAVAGTTLSGCAATGRRERSAFIIAPSGTPDRIRVGLVGCGGRGTGAAMDCVRAAPNVELVALGDLFRDRIDAAIPLFEKEIPGKINLSPERCFDGFDNYKSVLACDIDLVILATPPHFRPRHLAAAIEAGKHVFMEKPVAVDPVGVRSVIATSEAAAKKGLAIVCGTQRRHQPSYVETMKRIADGAIGDIVSGQCYWNQGDLWVKKQEPRWSDMEWQCRNWLYFCWLSGDHIVEQHVHNLDVMNWAMGGPPVKCVGMGGRQVRTAPEFGDIFDHFSVEYEYASGARVLSMCRQTKGASQRVSERLVGTHGSANPDGVIEGRRKWKYEPPLKAKPGMIVLPPPPSTQPSSEPVSKVPQPIHVNPYVQEHADLINSIRSGRPLNEGRRIAESTLTAIMGRMSAYTGREVSWDWVMKASTLDLTPPAYELGELPVGPVPMPGETKLV